MKLRIWSDLHLCFWSYYHHGNKSKFQRLLDQHLPVQEDDHECVLVLAGDVGKFFNGYDNTLKLFFNVITKRFKHVIYVHGNHELYSSTGLFGHEKEFMATKKLPGNVTYLSNDYKIIDNVMFIGTCLWTDCNQRNPVTMFQVEKGLNDYRQIKKSVGAYGDLRLSAEDTVENNAACVQFLKQALCIAKDAGFTPVVVTHHAPSELSVNAKYKGDELNHAFYTDLSWLMEQYEYPLHVHGHMHDSVTYKLYETQVVCNPFGYFETADKNPKFDVGLCVEV